MKNINQNIIIIERDNNDKIIKIQEEINKFDKFKKLIEEIIKERENKKIYDYINKKKMIKADMKTL